MDGAFLALTAGKTQLAASFDFSGETLGGADHARPLTALRHNSSGAFVAVTVDTPIYDHRRSDNAFLGLVIEPDTTDLQGTERRDLTSGWTSGGGGISTAKDATGIDSSANACTTLTASGANGTLLKAVTASSDDYTFSAWVRRKTGTGRVDITIDGGSTWQEITAWLLGGAWLRIGTDDLGPGFTGANPSIGFRIVTSGDEIEVDYVQLEQGVRKTSEVPNGVAKRYGGWLWLPGLDSTYGALIKHADLPTQMVLADSRHVRRISVSDVDGTAHTADLVVYYTEPDGTQTYAVLDDFALTLADTAPTFSPTDFTDDTDVAVSTAQTSDWVQVAGLSHWATAVLTDDGDGSAHTFAQAADGSGTEVLRAHGTANAKIRNSDYIQAAHTSDAGNSVEAVTTITVGGTAITYASTTEAASFAAKVAIFPGGANGYYEFDNTGLSDSDKFTIAFFCRFDNLASSSRAIFTIGDNYFLVYADTSGQLLFQAKNTGGTNLVNGIYSGSFAIDTDYGVVINGDLGATPVVEVVINGAVKTRTGGTAPTTGTIDFSRTAKPRIGSNIFNVHYMDGEIGMIWLVTGTSLDASDNYAAFFDTGTNKAKDLGTSGVVASTTPHYYVRWGDDVTDNSGSVDTVVNRGSLGSTATEKAADQITYGDA